MLPNRRLWRLRGLTTASVCARLSTDPYEQGGKPLPREKAEEMLQQIAPKWSLCSEAASISRTFRFGDSQGSLDFLPLLTNLARNDGHLPYEIAARPGRSTVCVTLSTPSLRGLTYNDFLLAFKLDANVRGVDGGDSAGDDEGLLGPLSG